MARILVLCLLLPIAVLVAQGQTPGTVQASGSATINVNPDQAQLTVGVVTQGATAQEAGSQNASQTTAMLSALTSVLGNNGKVQTIGYSVSPQYNNKQPAQITGYMASNTVQVTLYDLSRIGRLIDAANGAGANHVSSLNFGLQNPEPTMEQALSQAAAQARARAAAIASGLGSKTGAVVSAQQGGSVIPVIGLAGAASPTPIETGTVAVSATVTVTLALTQ